MKPNMTHIQALFVVFCFITTSAVATEQDAIFIPITLENTRLSDGSALPVDLESIGWKWLQGGTQGILESSGDAIKSASPLLITGTNLEAGAIYEVFGYFRADDAATEGTDSQTYSPVQFGLTLASLQPFDGERPDALVEREPWVITPGYKTGETYGYKSTPVEEEPLVGKGVLPAPPAGTRLILARLGFSRVGKDGTLPVFFAGYSSFHSAGHAAVVGVALSPADPAAKLDLVWKPGSRLHHAIRAGDPITIRREIELGADVNALDEENLTPLFYATACGDATLVRSLLDLGAIPDQNAQAVSPLVAAAGIADTELTKMLIGAGAKVPNKPAMDKGRLAREINPWLLHPVIAAIRSGSVPVLKQLLAANPTIHLGGIMKGWDKMDLSLFRTINNRDFIDTSLMRQNWDMAVFLIENGHIQADTFKYGEVLSRSVMAGPEAMPVVDALLRYGSEPAKNINQNHYMTALSTAAWRGNAELVRRLLSLVNDVGPYYPNKLLDNALYSENQDTIDVIRNRFPDAVAKRWQTPKVKDSESENVGTRFFLPRTNPPPQVSAHKPVGKHVLAVIAAPEASAAGDTLAAFASSTAGWQVVDREKIELALSENELSKPWLSGEHRLADLGDHFSADCLVLVTAIENGSEVIHRYEIVEVATGLEIHREHFKGGAFVDQKEIAGFLTRVALALDTAGLNERHQAITLLTFTAQGVKNPSAISRILEASVRHEVDSTAGLISLSRAQSSRLVQEQILSGKKSVWGAAHMIEGAVSAEGDDKIKVTLRLETYKDGKTTKTDAEATGEASSISEVTAIAWKKLMAAVDQTLEIYILESAAPDQALNEGRRLMREAEWLHSLHTEPNEFLPLIDSAIALGVPTRETIALHLDAYYCYFWPPDKERDGQSNKNPSSELQKIRDAWCRAPASLELSDRLAYLLPIARQFLHQTSWYLESEGSSTFKEPIDVWNSYGAYKNNEIWYAIQALSNIRSLIYRQQLTNDQRVEFDAFCSELDALTSRYFTLLKTVPDLDYLRYYIYFADLRLYERNPALVDGLVEMAASGASLTALLRLNPHMDPDTGEETGYGESVQELRKRLAKKMIARISDDPSIPMKLAKADLECFVAETSQRPAAIRRLAETMALARSHVVQSRQESGAYLLSHIILNSSTTSILFDRSNSVTAIENEAILLPSVLFSARSAPDLLIRFNTYHKVFHMLSQRAAWKQVSARPNLDGFRKKIGAYHPWELSRLEAATASLSAVNGPPSQTGSSSRGGAPGFFMPKNSSALISLLYGSGKKQNKTQNSPKNQTTKPVAKALTATLLADLRTDKSPGILVWPLVDNVNSDLLWVFYFPSSNDSFHVNVAGGSGLQIREDDCKAPWLLGIDCSTGKIIQKINLHGAVGEAYGLDLADRKCAVWDMVFDQTRSRILTNVGWFDENHASNKMGSVIIDKNTGKAHPLPRNPEIPEGEGNVFFGIWEARVGVVGVDEHFFYLNRASSDNGGAVKDHRSNSLAIFEVSPDLTVKPLSVIGRKPEATPFDSADRSPLAITKLDNHLRVVHESTIAHFDPKTRDWSIIAADSSRRPVKADVTSITDAQYWDFLQSIHNLRMKGKSSGWMAVGWNHRPGFLPFASRDKGVQQIRISTEIPDDFLNGTYAIDSSNSGKPGKENERKTLFKDHPRSKNYNMVVLGQTSDDFILGIQTSDYYEWNRPSRNASHLPFLWKVSKSEILEMLGEESPN